ncbi:MAG: DUF4350 domain-containing protein [Leptolyngbya sp. SIO1D8]|nr:DUF4350 domain-containing protein [Leptolyngbya sp. SIO1D8]
MTQSLSFSNRFIRIGILAVLLLCLLMVILAPAAGQKTSGSTFNLAPEGYLGWYHYMEEQGIPVQRWQRPIDDLLTQDMTEPTTLLRVYPRLVSPYIAQSREWIQTWVAAGNNLVVLGIDETIAEAPFTTRQESPQGDVIIKTRRRSLEIPDEQQQLADKHGAVVWRNNQPDAAGAVYFAVTPHLAANAYQDAPGNYAFLADLVSETGGPVWVDEYLHGYKAADVIVEEAVNSWSAYLSRTPLKIAVVQVGILLGILLISQNRRLGNLSTVKTRQIDNSQAYIEALAAVLYKAESASFLIDMITKAERLSLQKSLGFNDANVEDKVLREAWMQQTGQSDRVLAPLFKPPKLTAKTTDQILTRWLEQLRQLRQTPIR